MLELVKTTSLGKECYVDICNSNGHLLLWKCAEHDLLITITVFHLPNQKDTRSKHWHLDHVILRRTDRQDVRVTKLCVVQTAGQITDWVVSKLNLRIQADRMQFILQLQLPKDIHHANTKTGLMRIMKKLSRFLKKSTACTRQEEKHHLYKAHRDDNSSVFKKTASSNIYKTAQNRLRDMHDSWLRNKAEEIQSFADRRSWRSSMMH